MSEPVIETHIVHFTVAPWVNAYLAWLESNPLPANEDPEHFHLLDAFRAGWDAALSSEEVAG